LLCLQRVTECAGQENTQQESRASFYVGDNIDHKTELKSRRTDLSGVNTIKRLRRKDNEITAAPVYETKN
jgi:hypothetical protein